MSQTMLTAMQNGILFINGLFNGASSNSEYVASVMTSWEALFSYLPEAAEETYEKVLNVLAEI